MSEQRKSGRTASRGRSRVTYSLPNGTPTGKVSDSATSHGPETSSSPRTPCVPTPSDLVKRGEEARKRHQIDEALTAFRAALLVVPDFCDAHCGMGYSYLEVNMYGEALQHLEAALDVRPSSGRALYGAATALLELGRLEEAGSYALRLHELGDLRSVTSSHFIRGTIAYNEGRFGEAVEHLERSFDGRGQRDQQRTWRRNCYLLAQSYVELNRPERALHYLRLMNGVPGRDRRREKPWSRKVEDQIGRLHLELAQVSEAIASFNRILSRFPDDERALNGLGQAHLARHDGEKATEAFRKVLARNPNDIWALDGMAEACKLRGDLARAAGYIEQIRRLYTGPELQIQRRLEALGRERQRRDAELLRVRNIAALNVMATGIAHELRQPLSVIRLAAQNARKDVGSGDMSQLDGDLADIDRNVERIDDIINTLRRISAAEEGETKPTRLSEAVAEALTLFHAQLKNRGVELTLGVGNEWAMVDPPALVQIIVNLVSNARDAVEGQARGRIEIWSVDGPSNVWLYVRDNGKGMTREERSQALDPFFTTKTGIGTGLGLYIAYNLARKMGGRLSIKETNLMKGTTMQVELPRAEEKSE